MRCVSSDDPVRAPRSSVTAGRLDERPTPDVPVDLDRPEPASQDVTMPDVDVARLKRLRSAVSSTLASVPENSAAGLPPAYN